MPRTLAERARDWRWWGEQVAHLLLITSPPVGIILGLAFMEPFGWQIWAGLCASVWITVVREFIDGLPIESIGDALVDTLFQVVGGTVVGVIFWVLS